MLYNLSNTGCNFICPDHSFTTQAATLRSGMTSETGNFRGCQNSSANCSSAVAGDLGLISGDLGTFESIFRFAKDSMLSPHVFNIDWASEDATSRPEDRLKMPSYLNETVIGLPLVTDAMMLSNQGIDLAKLILLQHKLRLDFDGWLGQRTLTVRLASYFFVVGTATQLVILAPHIPWKGQGGGILLLCYSMICISSLAIIYLTSCLTGFNLTKK